MSGERGEKTGVGGGRGGVNIELIYLLTIISACRTGRGGRGGRGGGKKIIHHVVAVSCVSGASRHLWCWFLKAHAAYRLTPLDKGVCQVDYRSFLMVYLLYCLKKKKKNCDVHFGRRVAARRTRRVSGNVLTFGIRIIE